MAKKITTAEFIERSKLIKNNDKKYNYDKVEYINQNTKVTIYCNDCQKDFEILPSRHLHRGVGCPNCSKTKKLTKEIFEERARAVHGNKYDYSNYVYVNDATKSEIICDCGNVFQQSYMNHVRSKQGCPKCNGGIFVPLKEQIKKLNKQFDNKYDYSLIDESNYTTSKSKQPIICPVHGTFKMSFDNHLSGQGCPKCKKSKPSTTKEEFLLKLKPLNYNYIYDLKNFKNLNSVIRIKCELHGWFNKIASRHLYGKQGCPICKSSQGERKIFNILTENNIIFEREKRFNDCRYKNPLPFDFYIKKLNTVIEFDGIQHFKSIEYFGGEESLKNTQLRDEIKTDYCKNNNIGLIRIKYDDNIEDKLKDIL